ncbi:MAG: 50S ribosomal protein L35 [Clostridia bacterium]
MPKQRTHSGAGKRFKLTGNGKIKRAKMNRRHILSKKSPKRKRNLRKTTYVSPTQEKTITKMI